MPIANPTICIIIAAYNAEGTIARAVQSALAEPEVTEVIVVDDAFTNNTVAKAQSADDGSRRLKILHQKENGGPARARNRAINESNSDWIGILDADDFFLSGRIKTLLAYSEEADFIADDMWQVQEDDMDGVRKNLLGYSHPQPQIIGFTEFVHSNITQHNRKRDELGFPKPLMRRSFLDTHNLRYQENLRLGEDYELYARSLAHNARFIIVPAQSYVSVIRRDSLSGKHSESDLLRLRNCDTQLAKDFPFDKNERKALRLHYLSMDCRLQWRLLINAVKARSAKAAIATFLRPYPVPLYLLQQLAGEFYTRISARNRLRYRFLSFISR